MAQLFITGTDSCQELGKQQASCGTDTYYRPSSSWRESRTSALFIITIKEWDIEIWYYKANFDYFECLRSCCSSKRYGRATRIKKVTPVPFSQTLYHASTLRRYSVNNLRSLTA